MPFRFSRDRSHRDGDMMIAHYVDEGAIWWCLVCGDENVNRAFCGMCSQERGTWRCDECDHLNPRREHNCEQCGRPCQEPE